MALTQKQLEKQRERRERIKAENGKIYDDKQREYMRRYNQKKSYERKIAELNRLMKQYADEHQQEIDYLENTDLLQQIMDTQEMKPKRGRPKAIKLPPELFPEIAPVEKKKRGRPRKVINTDVDDNNEKQQLEIQQIVDNMTITKQTLEGTEIDIHAV